MTALHVAILDEELPFPLTSGKRIRSFQLLSRLASRHRLTYLCHRNPDAVESEQAERAMHDLGIRTIVVDRPVPSKSGTRFYARLAANLFSPLPYSVATHKSPALLQAARELNASDPPDLWHCEWTPYAETLRNLFSANCQLPTAHWLVMAHNVESLIWQRLADMEANPLKRWYIRRQQRKFERFEKWAYSACNCAIAVSGPDARLMRERFNARTVAVVDNGVDTEFFAPDPSIDRDPHRLLFLGSLDWRANLDAVRVLLDEIWPSVRRADERATLDVVGRRPPTWLRDKIAGFPGVSLHADVADVRAYIHRAGLMVVPLRIGGGSRLKILEALASGLPVISTPVGAEGLELDPTEHLRITAGNEAMTKGILDWMNDPEAALKSAESGRQAVLERYDWQRLANQLEAVWLRTANVKTPLQNSYALSAV